MKKRNATALYRVTALVLFVLIFSSCQLSRDFVGKATGHVACQKGDVNADGIVDDTDLELMIGYGLEQKEPRYLCCADINSDDVVNEMDYDAFFSAFLDGKPMGTCS